MSTPEGRVKNEVKKQLKALGAYQFWPVQTGMGAPTLDCLVCFRGLFVGIETKAPGKKPTPRQLATINQIDGAGGKTLVIDSVVVAKYIPELLNDAYHRAFSAEQSASAEPTDWPLARID